MKEHSRVSLTTQGKVNCRLGRAVYPRLATAAALHKNSFILTTAGWQVRETPADGERCRRPLDSLSRFSIFAVGEFDEEAAVELAGACPRGGVERAGGTICGPAIQPHVPAPESQRKHEVRSWTDPPFAVGLNEEVPAIGAELKPVGSNAAYSGARARMIEPQLAGGTVHLLYDPIREDPAEGPSQPGYDNSHLERWVAGSL